MAEETRKRILYLSKHFHFEKFGSEGYKTEVVGGVEVNFTRNAAIADALCESEYFDALGIHDDDELVYPLMRAFREKNRRSPIIIWSTEEAKIADGTIKRGLDELGIPYDEIRLEDMLPGGTPGRLKEAVSAFKRFENA